MAMKKQGSYDYGSSKYDVFVSFRGMDTRSNLTNHLYDALRRKKIELYYDAVSLEKEDENFPAPINAIENSKLAVVIFSEHYAYSSRCLDELVHILECKKRRGLVIIPVFYQVDVSDVQNQQGVYEAVFYKHEERYGNNSDKVSQWRNALTTLANLIGWESTINGPDPDLVEAITTDIEIRLGAPSIIEDFQKEPISANPLKHDIFLSFCSKDTYDNFTSHLYAALRSIGITPYNYNVKERDEILPEVVDAIRESELYVIVFSKYYALSSWCCGELEHITLCSEKFGRLVVPVFYDVDPSSVRVSLERYQQISEEKESLISDSDKQYRSRVGLWEKEKSTLGVDSDKQYRSKAALLAKMKSTLGVDTEKKYRLNVDLLEKKKSTLGVDSDKQCRSNIRLWEKKKSTLGMDSDKQYGSKVDLLATTYLPAWDSNSIKPESKLIDEIVGDILKKLQRISPSSDFNGLVGIPERIDHVKSMLDSGSPKVHIVGIVGTAGIGKTTLAKVLFDQLSIQFEASCFLSNIRELWMSGRRKYLRNKIVSALKFDKETLKNKKVLIVLDDVEEVEQLELLVRDGDQYGNGSRIITTSRNNIDFKAPNEVYQMKELRFSEALLLFHLNAFKTNSFTEDFMHLSKEMVSSFENFNPLTLKVLGTAICGKNIGTWIGTVNRLENSRNDPDDETQRVLRISFDLLEKEEKDVFLDIACFFKGEEEALSQRILDGCWSSASKSVKCLLEMSLITVLDSKLWMHDSLEALGKTIVQEKSIEEPGKRCRLWNFEDVYHVLKNNTGTAAVEAIFVDMCKIEKVELRPTVFSSMKNLRMLKFHSQFANCVFQFPEGDAEFLPSELRYLYWDAYPFDYLPIGFTGNCLVEIRLQFSKVKKLWEGVEGLENLKVMDLSFSKKLIEIPNLSGAPNIESLSLRGCVSLEEVPLYFQDLQKLVYLSLEDCSSIENVPALPENIININLARCTRLKSLPRDIYMLKCLRRLELSGCSSFDSMDFKKFSFSDSRDLQRFSSGTKECK